MRSRIVVLALALLAFAALASAQMRRPDPSTMSPYVLGILVKGPAWTAARTPRTDSIQAGHLANIRAMAASGALIGAGPLAGNHRERGFFIFKDLPMDSVTKLVHADPAIQSQRLMIELHRWLAPRGIGVAYRARARLRPENTDSMITVPVAFLNRPAVEPKMDSLVTAKAMAGHVGHILDMLKSGQALAAGPMFDDGPLRGLTFFGTDSATADRLAHDDPAIKAGRMNIEMMQWWTAWGILPPTPTVKELGQ